MERASSSASPSVLGTCNRKSLLDGIYAPPYGGRGRGWVLLLAAIALIVSCRHEPQMPLLVEAEAFLPAEPDSADTRLKRIDVQKLDGDEEAALYALLRTMADAMQGAAPLNDTLVSQAYNYYRTQLSSRALLPLPQRTPSASPPHGEVKDGLFRHFAQSALYMGDCYAAKDSIKASEDCYRQAIKYSEKAEEWHTCYIAYQRLAAQVQWSNEEEALRLINKAIEIYEKCNDDIANLLSLYHCAAHYTFQTAYIHERDFQEAIALAQKEYDLAAQHKLQLYEDQSTALMAFIHWAQGNYKLALDYARQIRHKSFDKDYALTWNRTIAQCYLSCDSLEQAKAFLQNLQRTADKKEAYLYARELAEISIRSGERDSAINYMDSAFSSAEAMYFEALQAKDDYYRDNLEKEKRNEGLIYKDKLKTWGFGAFALISLIVGSFAAWIIALKLRMHREKLSKAQKEMALIKEKHSALEDSQQKKSATIKYLQRYIIDQAEVTSHLKDTTTHIKMSAKNWNDVEQLLDEIDDGRISKIRARFKNLSIDDIRLCVMVRLGMSNPAIGNVYGITPSAVQHRKLALKKKGFGISDPEITLDKYLESL